MVGPLIFPAPPPPGPPGDRGVFLARLGRSGAGRRQERWSGAAGQSCSSASAVLPVALPSPGGPDHPSTSNLIFVYGARAEGMTDSCLLGDRGVSSGIDPESERILAVAAEVLMSQNNARAAAFLASVSSMSLRVSPRGLCDIYLAVPAGQLAMWPSVHWKVKEAFNLALGGKASLRVTVHAEAGGVDPDWRSRAL